MLAWIAHSASTRREAAKPPEQREVIFEQRHAQIERIRLLNEYLEPVTKPVAAGLVPAGTGRKGRGIPTADAVQATRAWATAVVTATALGARPARVL